MATKKRRAPAKKRNTRKGIPAARKTRRSDETATYVISYQFPNAESMCVRPETPWWRAKAPTMRTRVTGAAQMRITRSALRSSGAVNIRVRRLTLGLW